MTSKTCDKVNIYYNKDIQEKVTVLCSTASINRDPTPEHCLDPETDRSACALLATSDAVASPGPVGAAALTTENVDVGAAGRNSTLNILDGEVGNGDAGSRFSGG